MICFHCVLLRLWLCSNPQTFLWASSFPPLPSPSFSFPSSLPHWGMTFSQKLPSGLKTWNIEVMSYPRWLYVGCVFPSTNVKVEINLGNALGISPLLSLSLYPPGSCTTINCLSFQTELPGWPSGRDRGDHVLTDAVRYAGFVAPLRHLGPH